MTFAKATLLTIGLAMFTCMTAADEPNAERRGELLYLLKHDCGSCHGMTRQGGLGPSLLPKALSKRSDAILFATIMEGRSGTPMPGWRELLSEQDVSWLVQAMRRGDGLLVLAPSQGERP